MTNLHAWIGPYDGAWHCYGCGETRQDPKVLPPDGCKPLGERVLAALENPARWSRTHLTHLLRESVDLLAEKDAEIARLRERLAQRREDNGEQ